MGGKEGGWLRIVIEKPFGHDLESAQALTRAGWGDRARLDEARLMFEKMLSYANHLGLYAEEIGPNGEALGKFSQAFTHLPLISAAFNLDRTLGVARRPLREIGATI